MNHRCLPRMRFATLALAGFTLSAVAASASSSPQATQVWRTTQGPVALPSGTRVEAYPDGAGGALVGVLTAFGNGEAVLRSIDANGNERWVQSTPIDPLGGRFVVDVDPAGEIVTATNDVTNQRIDVHALRVDGTERWSAAVRAPPPPGAFAFFPAAVVEHASDQVSVGGAHFALNTTTFLSEGQATVARLDAAGAEVWRRVTPQHGVLRMDPAGDDLIVTYQRSDGIEDQYPVRVTRLDGAGAELWSWTRSAGAVQASVDVVDLEVDPASGHVVVQWGVTSGGGPFVETGVTCLDGQGNEVWSWSPVGSGAAREPFGMVPGSSGEVLVAMTESDSQSRRSTLTGLQLATGAEMRSGALIDRVATARGGFEAWPDGTARIIAWAWPGGPSMLTLDPALAITSETLLRTAPPGPSAPQTTIVTATSDGRDGLLMTGVDWHPSGPNPGHHGFRAKWAMGSAIGAPFCGPAVANSGGLPGTLGAIGDPRADRNNVTLVAEALPAQAASLFLVADATGSVPGAGGGQGTLCLGGGIGRYSQPGEIQFASAAGRSTLRLDLSRTPGPSALFPITPGSTWRFQVWYRDQNPGQTSNFTGGLALTFQ